MKIHVTLCYRRESVKEYKLEAKAEEGTTAGGLAEKIINDHSIQEGINFSGASIAVLVNGRLAADEMPLSDGDIVKIIPVAAGG